MFTGQAFRFLSDKTPLVKSPFVDTPDGKTVPTPPTAKFLVTMDGEQLTTMIGTYLQTMGPNSPGDFSFLTTESGSVLTTQGGNPLITQGPVT